MLHSFSIQAENQLAKKQRSSNLELYRVVCMLMIVAHHYVTNSGLTGAGGPLMTDFTSRNSIFLTLFGAWGKTGINCFMMITGYFMCTSKITLRKFIKLMGQVYFYRWLFFTMFLVVGYESLSAVRIFKLVMPVWNFDTGFVSCFIAFWLTIPFLNILVQNMSKRQHELLLVLMLTLYTFFGSIPTFNVAINYVTWFGIIYFIASYIRLYPQPIFGRRKIWGWMTLFSVVLGIISIISLRTFVGAPAGLGYSFVADSNKIFAVAIAFCSFLWFKNMSIKYSKLINTLGTGTFGVLLIHANSSAMRTWLWEDTIDVAGHYSLPLVGLVLFSFFVVLSVFFICNMIDLLRIATLEKWLLKWYDNKLSAKADRLVHRIMNN